MDNIVMPKGEFNFGKREQELVSRLYDAEVAAQDEEIGQVLDALDSLGLARNTVVILSADHGEELFEHGWLGHASTSLNGTLFDELIHIPLIISWPSRLPGGIKVEQIVEAVDLMPGLFDLIGLEWDGPQQGVSLLPLVAGDSNKIREAVFCETSICGYQCKEEQEPVWLRCVRTDRFKLVQTLVPHEKPSYSLYDLIADPGETQDVAGDYPEEVVRLKGILHVNVFENERLRASILASDSTEAIPGSGESPVLQKPCEVISPSEGETIKYSSYQGMVHVSWDCPGEVEYIIEYEVGRGKYHLKGSFPVLGNKQTFGPFNRIFWNAFPLYNPWRFRVIPKSRRDLAGPWRTFEFE